MQAPNIENVRSVHAVGTKFFTFQQDSTPTDWARETVPLMSANEPGFISPLMFPNPLTSRSRLQSVGVLQWCTVPYQNRGSDCLKQQHLITESSQFDWGNIDWPVQLWHIWLHGCVCPWGSHFEYKRCDIDFIRILHFSWTVQYILAETK